MKYLLIATMALVLSACGTMHSGQSTSSTSSTPSTSSMPHNGMSNSAVMIPETGNGD